MQFLKTWRIMYACFGRTNQWEITSENSGPCSSCWKLCYLWWRRDICIRLPARCPCHIAFCHTNVDFEKCNGTSICRCIGIRNQWIQGLKPLSSKRWKKAYLGLRLGTPPVGRLTCYLLFLSICNLIYKMGKEVLPTLRDWYCTWHMVEKKEMTVCIIICCYCLMIPGVQIQSDIQSWNEKSHGFVFVLFFLFLLFLFLFVLLFLPPTLSYFLLANVYRQVSRKVFLGMLVYCTLLLKLSPPKTEFSCWVYD